MKPGSIKSIIQEAYVHNVDALTDLTSHDNMSGPINPEFADEHKLLSKLHVNPEYTYNSYHNEIHRHARVRDLGFEATGRYVGNSSQVNKSLIKSNGNIEVINPVINSTLGIHHIDQFLSEATPLTRTHHIYSSLGRHQPNMKVGDTYQTPAFTSASIDPKIAAIFSNEHRASDLSGKTYSEHILHIVLPKGYTGGRYIAGGASTIIKEREMLLRRGQKFKVTGHQELNLTSKYIDEPIKRHIWTAVPLDHIDKPVEEAYEKLSTPDARRIFSKQSHDDFTPGNLNGFQFQMLANAKPEINPPDIEDQHKFLSSVSLPTFDKTHKLVISKYTNGNSYKINNALITQRLDDNLSTKENSKIVNHIGVLDGLFHDPVPLDHNVHTYSSLGFDPTPILKKSKVFRTPAFISSSLNPNIAVDFNTMHRLNGKSVHHVLHFDLPVGYKGAVYIAPAAHKDWRHQHEMLIGRDRPFVLTGRSVYPEPNHTVVVWHVKPHDTILKEATYHDPNTLRSFIGRDRYPDGYSTKINDVRVDHKTDASQQATRFDRAQQESKLSAAGWPHVISDYTNSSTEYHYIVMIGNPDPLDKVNRLDNELKDRALPLPEDTHVYSGLKVPPKVNIGDKVKTKTFTSTSLNMHTADYNTTPSYDEHSDTIRREAHMMHFILPKGYSKGTYVAPYSKHENEQEYILHRNQEWKVVGKKVINQIYKDHRGAGTFRHRIHIYSVVPADHPTDLTEATFHMPDQLRGLRDSSSYLPSKYSKSPRASAAHKFAAINHKQHTYDVDTQDDKMYMTADIHSDADEHRLDKHIIRAYTIDSRDYHDHAFRFNSNRIGAMSDKCNELERSINNLSTPLKEEVHTYSGLKVPAKVNIGDIFNTKSFTSTSLYMPTAAGHSTSFPPWENPKEPGTKIYERHIIHFILPKGYKGGAYIGPHSAFSEEQEYLLNRNQNWRVVHTKRTNNIELKNLSMYGNLDRGRAKTIHRYYVHSVVPHEDDKPLTEAYSHDHKLLLRSMPNKHSLGGKSDRIFDVMNAYSERHRKSKAESIEHFIKYAQHLGSESGSNFDSDSGTALRSYKESSTSLNKYLAGVGYFSSDSAERHEWRSGHISNAIREYGKPLEEETHVYSGLGPNPEHITNSKGGHFRSPAFTSTSFGPYFASEWASISGGIHKHIAHFILPKGYNRGIAITDFPLERAHLDQEREYLLDKNQVFNHVNTRVVDRDYGFGSKERVHIHSFTPVDDPKLIKVNPLNESTYHDSTVFHSAVILPKIGKTDFSKHTSRMTSVETATKAVEEDSYEQHQRMMNSYHNQTPLSYKNTIKKYVSRSENFHKASLGQTGMYGFDITAAQDLEDVIHNHPDVLTEHAHVYSGTRLNTADVKKGDVFHTPTFTSTSLNPTIAREFGETFVNISGEIGKRATSSRTILHFHLPVGYNKAVYAPNHTSTDWHEERELILNRKQNWKVTNIKKYNLRNDISHNVHVISLEPHTPSHLEEATYHDTSAFRDGVRSRLPKNPTRAIRYINNITSNRIKVGKDSFAQHERIKSNDIANFNILPDDKKKSLMNYSYLSSDIHHYNITGESRVSNYFDPGSTSKHDADNIEEAIRTSPSILPEGVHAYSGTKLGETVKLKAGDVFHTPTFTSTSLDPQMAKGFGKPFYEPDTPEKMGDRYKVILHFQLPKGYNKGAYMPSNISRLHTERELLLNKNQKWKVTRVKEYNRAEHTGEKMRVISVVPHED